MPCYDHRSSPNYIYEHEVEPLQERVDTMARWVCWLLKDRDTEWRDRKPMPKDLAKWAKEHEVFDKERKR